MPWQPMQVNALVLPAAASPAAMALMGSALAAKSARLDKYIVFIVLTLVVSVSFGRRTHGSAASFRVRLMVFWA